MTVSPWPHEERLMKPDGMLVEAHYLGKAREETAEQGTGPALQELSETEPILAGFIHESLIDIAGKLALSGAPTEIVQAVHEDVLTVILICHRAVRQGHYELWAKDFVEPPLEPLDANALLRPSKRKRKKVSNDHDENQRD